MAKKNMRLNKQIAKKNPGYIEGGLEDLLKEVSKESVQEGNLVRVNFEVTQELRNTFKSIVAQQGKKVKDVLVSLMEEYVKETYEAKNK